MASEVSRPADMPRCNLWVRALLPEAQARRVERAGVKAGKAVGDRKGAEDREAAEAALYPQPSPEPAEQELPMTTTPATLRQKGKSFALKHLII